MPHSNSWVQVSLRGLRHHGCSLWDRKLGFPFWFGAPTQGENYLSHGARPERRSSIIHYFHWAYWRRLCSVMLLQITITHSWIALLISFAIWGEKLQAWLGFEPTTLDFSSQSDGLLDHYRQTNIKPRQHPTSWRWILDRSKIIQRPRIPTLASKSSKSEIAVTANL